MSAPLAIWEAGDEPSMEDETNEHRDRATEERPPRRLR
jgi:hypothetical protein